MGGANDHQSGKQGCGHCPAVPRGRAGSAQKGRHSSSRSHALALPRQPRSAPTVAAVRARIRWQWKRLLAALPAASARRRSSPERRAARSHLRGRDAYPGCVGRLRAGTRGRRDALPSAVPLQDLPAGIAREIPPVQGHKFVKFDDRIVVVDPKSRVVVAMIPRYKLLPETWLVSQPRVQRIVAK